jgi:hypothetical protein
LKMGVAGGGPCAGPALRGAGFARGRLCAGPALRGVGRAGGLCGWALRGVGLAGGPCGGGFAVLPALSGALPEFGIGG